MRHPGRITPHCCAPAVNAFSAEPTKLQVEKAS
jgi:hypothetical protein